MLVAATVFISGYLSYDQRVKNLQDKYLDNLNALANLQESNIQGFIERSRADIDYIRNLEVFETELNTLPDDMGSQETSEEDAFGGLSMAFDEPEAGGYDFSMDDAAGSLKITRLREPAR